MKCDYCGKPATQLAGETNGVLVCNNHAPRGGVEVDCSGLCGEHHWLDRTESDSRECLICGAEVTA